METKDKNTTKVLFLSDGSTWETLGGQIVALVTDKGMERLEKGDCHLTDLITSDEIVDLIQLETKG